MHVVAEVWDHEREARQVAASEVSVERRQRNGEPAGRPKQVAEVEKGQPRLFGARDARALPEIERQVLDVHLPGQRVGGERLAEIPAGEDAARAVVTGALRRAGDQREVVRQAWVRDRVVARQQSVVMGEPEKRRAGVAQDPPRRVVLEDDDDGVAEPWHQVPEPSYAQRGARSGGHVVALSREAD